MNAVFKKKLEEIAARIGHTPLVDLGDGIFGKVEGENPQGR